MDVFRLEGRDDTVFVTRKFWGHQSFHAARSFGRARYDITTLMVGICW